MDLINAYMAPTHNILEVISELEKSSVKKINKIIEISGWRKSKDRNIFSQALKNQDVEELIRLSIANGVTSINTLTIIYLRE